MFIESLIKITFVHKWIYWTSKRDWMWVL